MRFKLLKKLKQNKTECVDPLHKKIEKDKMNIELFINDIVTMLHIECPTIESVACLYESAGQIIGQREFRRSVLPEDAQYRGGYYFDEKNFIVYARRYPLVSQDNLELYFRNTTSAEKLFFLAHELRHVWQKKFHADMYYEYNAIGKGCIEDISEIDADAFAIAYVFSERTPFIVDDIPHVLGDISLYTRMDNGKRWNRIRELSNEYKIGDCKKIEQVKVATCNYLNLFDYTHFCENPKKE